MSPRTDFWLIAVLTAILLVQVGCNNQSAPPVSRTAEKQEQDSVPAIADSVQPKAPEVAPSTTVSAESEKMVRDLKQLYSQAVAAETEFRFPDAVKHWKQTVTLLEKLHGPNSWQLKNSQLALATTELQCSFSPNQMERLKSLVGAQKEIAGLISKGDYKAGLAISRQLTLATADLFGEDSWMKTKQDIQSARLEQLNGKTETAVGLFQKASGQILKHAGSLHPELESVHGYLAECFTTIGNRRLALANFSKATALAESLWGTESLQFASRANDLGVSYESVADHSTAVRVLRVSEVIRRNVLGESHPLVAHSRLNLSIAYLGIGELQIAHDLVKQAEGIFRTMPNGQEMLVQALRQRSTIMMLSDTPGQAEAPLRELTSIAAKTNDGGLLAAEYMYRLGVCLGRQGKFEESGTVLQQALETRSLLLGGDNAETVKIRELLVQMHDRAGQPARAAEANGSVRPTSFTMPDSTTPGK